MTNPKTKVAAALAVLLAAQLPALALFISMNPTAEAVRTPAVAVSNAIPDYSPESVSDDVLWLARCIYSETKQAHEQTLVAWVIRNRVETRYRGEATYEGVVTDPYQFSAFNPGSSKRTMFVSLTPASDAQGWEQALRAAHGVYHAPAAARPFGQTTRHFYSERSMPGRRAPNWANGKSPVQPVGYRVNPERFRFYEGLASVLPLSVRL
jgi:spore germination cell wall hydrolase CwlJ-like protein